MIGATNLVTNIDAILVQFKKPIFEDDFPEKGMTAWLTDVEWDNRYGSYKLYFYFGEHEDVNKKYFKKCYYPTDDSSELLTALESENYDPYYSTNFSLEGDVRNDMDLYNQLLPYLHFLQ